MPALTLNEHGLGLYAFRTVSRWSEWVLRRVEAVEFVDSVTVQRRVSVDLRLPMEPTPLIEVGTDRPLYCVPLALLQKRVLRNFDLRDERGAVLPLLTRPKNGAIATALLETMATVIVAPDLRPDDPSETGAPDGLHASALPDVVLADLWRIANLPSVRAHAHLDRLLEMAPREDGDDPAAREYEEQWRAALTDDPDFMTLATDLAGSFLVITQIVGAPFDRRILKFSYEEELPQRERIPSRLAKERSLRVANRALHRRQTEHERRLRETGETGVLVCQPRLHGDETGAILEGVTFVVTDAAGSVVAGTSTKTHDVTVRVTAGDCRVTVEAPSGTVEVNHGPRAITVGGSASHAYEFRQSTPLARNGGQPQLTKPSRRRQLLQNIGIRATEYAIRCPAVGHGASYHLEVDLPDEVRATTGQLSHYGASTSAVATVGGFGSRQRVHLHVSEVPQERSGIALLTVRARSSAVARSGTITGGLTAALLAVVAARYPHLGAGAGPVVTLLLVLPGGASAYTARRRESPMTTDLALWQRVLALGTGLAAFTGATMIAVTAGETHYDHRGLATALGHWAGGSAFLGGMACIAATSAAILGTAWYCADHPVEMSTAKGQGFIDRAAHADVGVEDQAGAISGPADGTHDGRIVEPDGDEHGV